MRALVSLVAVAVAVVGQLTIVDRIAFPGGAGPDLVLVLVAALGLATGPMVGSLTGFLAGLALDIAPPGSHFAGQNALVFCLVGYSCGLLADAPSSDGVTEQGHTALFEIVVTAVGAVCGEALAALLGAMLSDPRVTWPAITHMLPAAAACDAAACPFVLYAAAAALRLAGRRGPRGQTGAVGWSAGQPRMAPSGAGPGGLRPAGGLGAAFAGGGSLSGQAKVRFTSRRREGVLGGAVHGGSLHGGSLHGGSLHGGSPYGGTPGSSGLARTRMGRSLLGGSMFSQPSPALARTTPPGRPTLLGGRSLAPRFSRGKAVSRLTGALRRPTRLRSPGRGWLRTSPRSGALGGSGTLGRGSALGRRAFRSRTFRTRTFRSGGHGGRNSAAGAWKRGRTPRLRARKPARLPFRKPVRRGGYR